MNVDDVKKELGGDAELFTFKIVEGYIIVRPRQKLGTEKFAECAEKLKAVGGEYVRFNYDTKKGGHFKVKSEGAMSTVTKKEEQRAQLTLLGHLRIAITELAYVEEKLKELQKK